jgi:hypothetical protein
LACRFTAALRQDDAAKVGGAYESATDWPKLARCKQKGSTAHESHGAHHRLNPTEPIIVGVSHQIGHYADVIRVPAGYEQIITSGTPG